VKHRVLVIVLILLTAFSLTEADTKEQLWRFVTGGRIRAYPAVGRDGNVYLISDDRFLYSLNYKGEQRWRFYLEERLTDCFAIGIDGTIYIGHKTGELSAVHGYGGVIWRFNTNETLSQAPAIRSDGTIVLGTEEGTLFAISHQGVLRWKYKLQGKPSSPPVIDVDNSIITVLTDGSLIVLEPWGQLRWRLRLTGVPGAPAIGRDGTLYIGTSAGNLHAIAPPGRIVWTAPFPGALFSPVIGPSDNIYLSTNHGEVAGLSPKGDLLWTLPLSEIPAGPCVIGETGTLYVSTLSSTLFAISPEGKIRWNAEMKGLLTNLILSPQKIIYAGSSDWTVFALNGEKPAVAPWPMYQHDNSHTGRSERDTATLSIEERFKNELDFVYFQSLLLSGNPDLMEKGLGEIRRLHSENNIKQRRPFLLYLLRKIAGYTVIEDDKTARFPLRGYSSIRQEACLLYTQIGALEAYPLLILILQKDEDLTIKTVAVGCLSLLQSDPDSIAVNTMANLIITTPPSGATDSFAREVVIAMKNISQYHGTLTRDGVNTLLTISEGQFASSVRKLAHDTLLELAGGKKIENN
jgi:outer membrane protein assembly factor BamB